MAHHAVPTFSLLFHHHLDVTSIYKHCNFVPETVILGVCDCVFAEKGFDLPTWVFSHKDFNAWLDIFHDFGLVALLATSWVVWKELCKYYFAGELEVLN